VIATLGTPATEAALAATKHIPIVMLAVGDPVRSGFVNSLSHPGRNVTGVSIFTVDLAGKQFEILRDLIPRVTKIAVLWNPANAVAEALVKRFERAASGKGGSVTRLAASRPEELAASLAPLASRRFEALFVPAEAMFTAERQQILNLVASARVPALYGNPVFVDDGGLASYGHDIAQTGRRAAAMVDKILKGAAPADLPVEEPTRFLLKINLKTAKNLGLTIPPSLLQRVDQVIE
jgi:putative ABC transport system substrate-binding protein